MNEMKVEEDIKINSQRLNPRKTIDEMKSKKLCENQIKKLRLPKKINGQI